MATRIMIARKSAHSLSYSGVLPFFSVLLCLKINDDDSQYTSNFIISKKCRQHDTNSKNSMAGLLFILIMPLVFV